MSAAPGIAKAVTAPPSAARPPATLRRAETPVPRAPEDPPGLAHRVANEWLPRVAWTISRTGRLGLVGIALLLASALFLLSTHLKVAAEVEALRADLAAAQRHAGTAADNVANLASGTRELPARTDMPAILRQLFNKATQARLAVDTGKYEISASGSSSIVRYQIALPVTGPYTQIRAFIDATLATMPAVGLSDLVLDRKSIADFNVEAQMRMTVYTVATGTISPPEAGSAIAVQASPGPSEAGPGSDRVVAPTRASALFAQHSWYVLPPPPPPAPPPPTPVPTAPAFPYTFIGSYAPEGHPPVFFLSHGDRMVEARVGDLIDGVYQFESAAGGQLVFVYVPLNVRQTLAAGVSQ